MIFVGKSTAAALERLGIYTIGQLAESSRGQLENHLGKLGAVLWDYANGLDDSPVQVQGVEDAAKSVSNSITFRQKPGGVGRHQSMPAHAVGFSGRSVTGPGATLSNGIGFY